MRILDKIEQWLFPCLREIERVSGENRKAAREAVNAIQSVEGQRSMESITRRNNVIQVQSSIHR